MPYDATLLFTHFVLEDILLFSSVSWSRIFLLISEKHVCNSFFAEPIFATNEAAFRNNLLHARKQLKPYEVSRLTLCFGAENLTFM